MVLQLRFVFVESYDAIRRELYKAGNLGICVLPAMVIQEDTDAYVGYARNPTWIAH